MGSHKIRDTFLGVLIVRIIVLLGIYWCPLILGNYCIVLSHTAIARPPLVYCISENPAAHVKWVCQRLGFGWAGCVEVIFGWVRVGLPPAKVFEIFSS